MKIAELYRQLCETPKVDSVAEQAASANYPFALDSPTGLMLTAANITTMSEQPSGLLRYVMRHEQRVLQQQWVIQTWGEGAYQELLWRDVPLETED